jgi:hypothetical protein
MAHWAPGPSERIRRPRAQNPNELVQILALQCLGNGQVFIACLQVMSHALGTRFGQAWVSRTPESKASHGGARRGATRRAAAHFAFAHHRPLGQLVADRDLMAPGLAAPRKQFPKPGNRWQHLFSPFGFGQ